MSNVEQQNETEVTTIPKKQKSSKAAIIIICCVVLAAAAAIGALFGLPYLNYENAVKAMETADYEKAMTLLEQLSSNSFLSDEKKTDALYLKAEALFATKKYAEAKAIYTELGEYKDSADKLAECAYQNAIQLEDQGKYMEAYDEYMELGQYKDVAERRNTCCLNAMKSAIETNDAQKKDLIELCIKNPTIRDDAHEYIAISLETDIASGKNEEVYTMITEMLSSYTEHYLEPIYQLAIGYIEAKDHTKGAELLDLIVEHEYKDSADLVMECKYLSATELMKSAPEQAIEPLYDLGVAEYKDSRELLNTICTSEWLFEQLVFFDAEVYSPKDSQEVWYDDGFGYYEFEYVDYFRTKFKVTNSLNIPVTGSIKVKSKVYGGQVTKTQTYKFDVLEAGYTEDDCKTATFENVTSEGYEYDKPHTIEFIKVDGEKGLKVYYPEKKEEK